MTDYAAMGHFAIGAVGVMVAILAVGCTAIGWSTNGGESKPMTWGGRAAAQVMGLVFAALAGSLLWTASR